MEKEKKVIKEEVFDERNDIINFVKNFKSGVCKFFNFQNRCDDDPAFYFEINNFEFNMKYLDEVVWLYGLINDVENQMIGLEIDEIVEIATETYENGEFFISITTAGFMFGVKLL